MISKEIQALIESEEYAQGQKLPSERDLALAFGAQRATVRSALQILLQKGVLVARERQGYFVAPRRIVFDLAEFKSTHSIMKDRGTESHTRLLSFERIKVNEKLREKTMLPEGTDVYAIMRLRYEAEVPVSLERSYIVCEMAEGLAEEDVTDKSLYAALKSRFHIKLAYSNQKVTIVYANGLESALLNVSLSKPLMKYQGLVYDRQQRLIEFFEDISLMERIEFISNNY